MAQKTKYSQNVTDTNDESDVLNTSVFFFWMEQNYLV